MGKEVRIADAWVGDGHPCLVVAEIGINHNGDLETARKLISSAKEAGCWAVKFQKRTIDVVYSASELARPRESPFGETNGDLKRGLEFGPGDYQEINRYCEELDIGWFASCWDESSIDLFEKFCPPCYKVASAGLTDDNLLRHHRKYGRPIILSTGMSTMAQIDHAIDVLGTDDLILMHCTSTYPAEIEELNLKVIETLKSRYQVPVGYSGHEVGLAPTIAAATIGACIVERHLTLDRAMWGSDQAASVEPQGIARLVRDIRVVEDSIGDGLKRVYERELESIKKLRRVG